jgi:tRNA G10  N-methylase Trm11
MKHLLILGRDPSLSIEELYSYFKARNIKFKILKEYGDALIVDLPSLDLKKVIKDLGGIQKIAQEMGDNLYNGKENKLKYAISNYTQGDISEIKAELKAYFKSLGVKAMLKKSHHKQDFLTPSEAQNVLEIVVYDDFIGKTVAVSNPQSYKLRDLKRPVQERLHSTSIRLAKIMINLSGAKKGDKMLDPFCGVGTFLQEGMLMGIECYGIDKKAERIKATKKNIEWLRRTYNVSYSFKLFLGDATRLSSHVKKVDYVVSEPFMGPFLKKLPTTQEARKIIAMLEPMYKSVLKEIRKVRAKRAVIVVPVFLARSRKKYFLNLDLKDFRVKSFDYETPTSRLRRQILVLEPKHL